MLHNQKGFMMPLALILTTLTVLLCLHLIVVLHTEQIVLVDRYIGIKGDTLLRNGIKSVINDHPDPKQPVSGTYHFGEDILSFQENPINDKDVKITLNTRQKIGATRHAIIHYDPKEGEILSWTE